MNFKQIKEHYNEEMNFEVLWDIALISKAEPKKSVVMRELSDRFWGADPFLFDYCGRTYLFYEQYDRKNKKGLIAYRNIEKDLSYTEPKVAIEENFHMSFPCIFTYGDAVYMIPETSSDRSIRLYKSEEFPDKWAFVKRITEDFPAVDTIVYSKGENGVVLHTSIGDSCNVENYIIECDNAFNVVNKFKVKDFSECGNRNAGNIIVRDNKTIRVGQDCSGKVYGKGLIMYEQKHNYEELETEKLSYNDFALSNNAYCGIHTYNEVNDFKVVDLKYTIKKPLIKKIGFITNKALCAIKRRLRWGRENV